MTKITLKGNPVNTLSSLPKVGSSAPEFTLTKTDLSDVTLEDFKGKNIILNIFPSLDTSVCAASVRRFNAEAEKLKNTVVLCVSRDLPYAHRRFCTIEGLKNVVPLSELRNSDFGKDYGIRMTDGTMEGLFSRAIVVINENGKVIYTEQVPEISQEPDYEEALDSLR